MTYDNIIKGTFISKPNRFIANVVVNGKMETAHVKNTGRLGELLREGAAIYMQHHEETARRTKWSLIGVEKTAGWLTLIHKPQTRSCLSGFKQESYLKT